MNDKIAETASMLQIFAVENLAATLNAGGYDQGLVPRKLVSIAER
jgi:hypothetical protein